MDKKKNYDNYVRWKQWGSSESTSIFVTEAYEAELSKISIKSQATILEVGFGDGRFLNWATRKGYSCIGTELIEELVLNASSKGYKVYLGDISSLPAKLSNQIDLICLWDVLEHMEKKSLPDFFRHASDLLNDTGKIILRVPNGVSPFSKLIQYGDYTHETVVSAPIIEQLALPHNLLIDSVANSYRSKTSGNTSGFLKRLAYMGRDLTEILLGYLYYGKRIPLDPVITVILKKK